MKITKPNTPVTSKDHRHPQINLKGRVYKISLAETALRDSIKDTWEIHNKSMANKLKY
jgi:hypothetical protein